MQGAPPDTAFTAIELETIPAFPFLVAAYSVVFVAIFLYLVSIHVRQRRLERELASLEKRLEAGD